MAVDQLGQHFAFASCLEMVRERIRIRARSE